MVAGDGGKIEARNGLYRFNAPTFILYTYGRAYVDTNGRATDINFILVERDTNPSFRAASFVTRHLLVYKEGEQIC